LPSRKARISEDWDVVRFKAQKKAIAMRSQGWSGAAMLPYAELEYSVALRKLLLI